MIYFFEEKGEEEKRVFKVMVKKREKIFFSNDKGIQ